VADGQDPGEPASDIYVPIVENQMENVRIAMNSSDAEVAGIVVRAFEQTLRERPGNHFSKSVVICR
jgi:hypothetical protein